MVHSVTITSTRQHCPNRICAIRMFIRALAHTCFESGALLEVGCPMGPVTLTLER